MITKTEMRVTEGCNRMTGPCGIKCFSRHKESEGWESLPGQEMALIHTMFQKQQEAGIQAVNIVGGEPLIRSDVPEILALGKIYGFSMILSTNGDFVTRELMDSISPNLDWMAISLDGENPEKNDSLRGEGQFASVMRVLRDYDPSVHKFGLKINTVVSAINLNDGLDAMGDLIAGKAKIWKLIQFTPRGQGLFAQDGYALQTESFEARVLELQQKNPELYICSRVFCPDDPPDVLIIRPNGEMIINYQYRHILVGNIHSDDLAQVIRQVDIDYPGYVQGNTQEYRLSYLPGE